MNPARPVVLLALACAVAAANWVLLGTAATPAARVWLVAAPLVLGVAGALLGRRPGVAPVPAAAPAPAGPPPETAALHLLGALQEEGRLVDFLLEDVAAYSDEQIGAAVRGIHEPCRTALRGCLTIEPVMPAAEGDVVTVPTGFDPSSVRLVGNVAGAPPFSGTLRHAGWRVTAVAIPAPQGRDARVLAPAEVELA